MVKLAGMGIKDHFNTTYQVLAAVYPDHSWEPWRFDRTPSSFLNDPSYVQKSLLEIEKKLNIKNMEGIPQPAKGAGFDVSTHEFKVPAKKIDDPVTHE